MCSERAASCCFNVLGLEPGFAAGEFFRQVPDEAGHALAELRVYQQEAQFARRHSRQEAQHQRLEGLHGGLFGRAGGLEHHVAPADDGQEGRQGEAMPLPRFCQLADAGTPTLALPLAGGSP
jgi:hypothetical protein